MRGKVLERAIALSLLLSAGMYSTVWAEEEVTIDKFKQSVSGGNISVKEDTTVQGTGKYGGDFAGNNRLDDLTVTVGPGKKLILNNIYMANPNIEGEGDIHIILDQHNGGTGNSGIYIGGNITANSLVINNTIKDGSDGKGIHAYGQAVTIDAKKIEINSYDDGVYSTGDDGTGKDIIIKSFDSLDITSKTGFGIDSNGNGNKQGDIYIKGNKNSTINITGGLQEEEFLFTPHYLGKAGIEQFNNNPNSFVNIESGKIKIEGIRQGINTVDGTVSVKGNDINIIATMKDKYPNNKISGEDIISWLGVFKDGGLGTGIGINNGLVELKVSTFKEYHKDAKTEINAEGGKTFIHGDLDGIRSVGGTVNVKSGENKIEVKRDYEITDNSAISEIKKYYHDGIYTMFDTTVSVESTTGNNEIVVDVPYAAKKQTGIHAFGGKIDVTSKNNNIISAGQKGSGAAILAGGTYNPQDSIIQYVNGVADAVGYKQDDKQKGTVNLKADGKNELTGAVVAQYGSNVNITGKNNTISASYLTPGTAWDAAANNGKGKSVAYDFVSAVRAGTDPDYNPGNSANGQSTINISADGNNRGVLNISTQAPPGTYTNTKGEKVEYGGLERAVWAYNGVINLNSEDNPAQTHIRTTYGSPYDTTKEGAALFAGNAGDYTGTINAYMGAGSSIYGDIVGAHSGIVNVKMGDNSSITGNILAGNGSKNEDGTTKDGKVTVTLGAHSTFNGRTDDYYTIDNSSFSEEHSQIFKNPAFSREIKSSGEITLTLGDNSTWNLTGQSWITNLNLGKNVTIDMCDKTMHDKNAQNNGAYAIYIGKISGEGTFNLNLNANDRNLSEMIYIKDAVVPEGKEHLTETVRINYIEGLEKLLPEYTGDDKVEKLRFSTVNSDYGEMSADDDGTWGKDERTKITAKDRIIYKGVLGGNVLDYKEKGVLNRTLYIGKETYDTVHDVEENKLYNSSNPTTSADEPAVQTSGSASAASANESVASGTTSAAAPKRVKARVMSSMAAVPVAQSDDALVAQSDDVPVAQSDTTEDKGGNELSNQTHGGENGGTNHYVTAESARGLSAVESPDESDPNTNTPTHQPTLSDQGRTIINMGRLNYEMGIYMDRLNKRLGEARFIDGEKGLWVRGQHTKLGRDNSFDWNSNMYQIGYESYDECDNKEGYHRKGIAFDYTKGDVSYSDIWGKGEGRRRGVWLYDTWFGNKGHYKDVVLKYGHLDNEFDYMTKTDYENVTGDYDNNAFALSFEWGYKDYHDSEEYRNRPIQPDEDRDEWYFEPQMQLQYTYMTGADYQTNQQINGGPMIHSNVDMDHVHSLIGRLGFRWGFDHHYYDENKEEVIAKKANYYIKADVLHEFLGDQDITVSDSTTGLRPLGLSYDHKGTWYDIGIGYTRMMDDNSYFFIDAEKIIGNHYDNSYQINVGMHWSF